MRLATFNIESLDASPKDGVMLAERVECLRPQLERLNADILCLQEVNSQKDKGRKDRSLGALEVLLKGTQYEDYELAATRGAEGGGLADVHNLVTLSRFPILSLIEIRHTLLPPPVYQMLTSAPPDAAPRHVYFERPALVAELACPGSRCLTIVNVHLRAPLASPVAGQKLSPFSWRSTAGWAEGFFLSSLKRNAQALEIRLALENMFDADPQSLIAVCGDLNAQDHETPVKILQAAEEDTGNGHLATRSLIVADRAIPQDRRHSVLHHGRPQMLDHVLLSRSLGGFLKSIELHNEALSDEADGAGTLHNTPGSYHAPLVATFAID
jgi:endonuclease/exonuclease/phosphatase family metal-dependent hydrolase